MTERRGKTLDISNACFVHITISHGRNPQLSLSDRDVAARAMRLIVNLPVRGHGLPSPAQGAQERRPSMLVLSRRPKQRVLFPELGITVEVVQASRSVVRLAIDAPPSVSVV